jgi:8-oxo-dGTP pyrophosphatase MutT (NUDIX family)
MNEAPATWRRVQSQHIADCRVFRVRSDECVREEDGLQADFYVVENPDWVNIVALTESGEVVVIEQFRHGVDSVILEIPGGMVDPNESPEGAARRELIEETGYACGNLKLIGTSRPNPAIQNNTIFHYLAEGCVKTHDVRFDDHESIVTRTLPLDTVEELIKEGSISHSLVVAEFFYLYLHKK